MSAPCLRRRDPSPATLRVSTSPTRGEVNHITSPLVGEVDARVFRAAGEGSPIERKLECV